MRGIRLNKGQVVRLETPGGGGYGRAEMRKPESVANDVRRELLSEQRADELYGTAWREVSK